MSSTAKWRKFTRQEIERFVQESFSYATLADKLGYSKCGGSYLDTVKNMISELDLDVSHFTGQGWLSGKTYQSSRYMSFDEYVKNGHVTTDKLRKKLLRDGLKNHICECCNNTTWNNVPIPLEVHHVDGDLQNNSIDNLQLLCPNCHALTDNYRGKNIQKHKLKKFLQEHQEEKSPE